MAAVDITPLRRHRDFRLLYIGRFVSLFGNQITFVAVPYQVFTLTHSTVAVGLLGVVELAALFDVRAARRCSRGRARPPVDGADVRGGADGRAA